MKRTALVFSLLSASPALAVGFEVDGAFGYWFSGTPQLQARLGVHQRFATLGNSSSLVGALRSGVLFHTVGSRLGIPLDVALELRFGPISFGAVGGVWFLFNEVDVIRAHVGGEFGVRVWKLRLSLEAGWLQSAPLLLGRVGVHF